MRNIDYQFLVDLASAALGGKKNDDASFGMDTGEGADEMTDDQEAALRAALGEDFDGIYGI